MKNATGITVLALAAALIGVQTDALAQASAPLGKPELQDTVPPMAKYGKAYTPGWALMTKDEQKQFGAQVRALKNATECQALMAQNQQKMAERAKAKGLAAPAKPKRDACGELQP
jgi:hypothetical protein